MYEGMFENNKRHGQGIYKWANGDVYKGSYQNGKMHGEGICTLPNGAIYEGQWINNDFLDPSYAIATQALKSARMAADLPERDKRRLEGTDTNGTFTFVYRGQVKDGVREGLGVLIWSNGK